VPKRSWGIVRRHVVTICVALFAAVGAVGALAAEATVARAGPECGNESLRPKPDGEEWSCSFDDEFDSTTGDASSLSRVLWTPQLTATSGYTTGPGAARVCYVNAPHNVSVSGGALHLTVRREPRPFFCGLFSTQYTGGMVSTIFSFHQTYGRFEVRARLPQTTVRGLQETLWLWPVNHTTYGPWPASGEVDFSEFYSRYYWLDIPYIHYNYSPSTLSTPVYTNFLSNYCPIAPRQFNDYALTWSPGRFQITINGHTCLTDDYVPNGGLTRPQPFNQPFFISLTQALGIGTNAFNPRITPLPATTSVDYVRVWK
jgi:beta-glucanase (GH16 family)